MKIKKNWLRSERPVDLLLYRVALIRNGGANRMFVQSELGASAATKLAKLIGPQKIWASSDRTTVQQITQSGM